MVWQCSAAGANSTDTPSRLAVPVQVRLATRGWRARGCRLASALEPQRVLVAARDAADQEGCFQTFEVSGEPLPADVGLSGKRLQARFVAGVEGQHVEEAVELLGVRDAAGTGQVVEQHLVDDLLARESRPALARTAGLVTASGKPPKFSQLRNSPLRPSMSGGLAARRWRSWSSSCPVWRPKLAGGVAP